jgi:multicomponent Na+:H+ antiporter subunit B
VFWAVDYLLLALLLTAAFLVIRLRNLNACVMALSALGLLLTVVFVVLGAPDVAHAEVVVGGVALPTLFLIAIGKARTEVAEPEQTNLEETSQSPARSSTSLRTGGTGAPDLLRHRPHAAVPSLLLLAALVVAMLAIPRGARPLPGMARHAIQVALPQWHLTEVVNEVVYGTRAFDTFGETFLLLAAVLSVVVLTRPREPRSGYVGEDVAGRQEQLEIDPHLRSGPDERQAREAEREEEGLGRGPLTTDAQPFAKPFPERGEEMTVVVRMGVRVVAVLLTTAGCFLVVQGYTPGGGFPAGAVLLGVVLLIYVAHGYHRVAAVVRPAVAETIELLGALAIIVLQSLGLLLRGSFTANWVPLAPARTLRSGGIAQAFSLGEFVVVSSGLVIVVFAVLGATRDWTSDDDSADSAGQDRTAHEGGDES